MTSEAEYMDDCHHVGRYEEEHAQPALYEVVNARNIRIFLGSRASCWAFKRKHGGYVREIAEGGSDA